MEKVTVFLRTALFTLGLDDGHVPPGVAIVDGDVVEQPSAGLTLLTRRMRDERGRVLSERAVKVLIPWSKIDHVHLHEG
jgi:hypothetical protein